MIFSNFIIDAADPISSFLDSRVQFIGIAAAHLPDCLEVVCLFEVAQQNNENVFFGVGELFEENFVQEQIADLLEK